MRHARHFTRAVLNVHMGSYISANVDHCVNRELAPRCTASSLHFLVRLLLTRSIAFGNENGRLPSEERKEGEEEGRHKKFNLWGPGHIFPGVVFSE